ncbi:MAG: hypothetical protein HOM34_03780, partial [Planctomycetes bacterium]|nr:hypothetical protein [Planctomycetota bacterium]MBT5119825.1 hypothetical protein [Planctomycetota bacterium]
AAAHAAGTFGGGPPVAMMPGSNGNSYPTSDPEAVAEKGELQAFKRLDYSWADADATLDVRDIMTAEQAQKWVGKVVIVEGLVVRSRESRGSTFLNFREDDYRKAFTVYSKAGGCDFAAPLDELCLGKRIAILGEVLMYKGTPEIVLDQPSQLRLID